MTRTVLITGGGTGIGRAIADRFSSDGDHVIITGRRTDVLKLTADQLAASSGADVTALTCDATEPADVLRLVEALPAGVDVLVNNAGGNTDFDRPAPNELPELAASWRANLEANLISAVLATHAVRDRLRSGGSVIHIGSIAADKGAGGYGAAKAGLASWNIDIAAELGRQGVTSNVVSPGYIADTEFFRDRMTAARHEALVAATMTGRAGAPEDIAATVHFLASPGARQITGQLLAVNGGERTTR